jgi:hypothetical protein
MDLLIFVYFIIDRFSQRLVNDLLALNLCRCLDLPDDPRVRKFHRKSGRVGHHDDRHPHPASGLFRSLANLESGVEQESEY